MNNLLLEIEEQEINGHEVFISYEMEAGIVDASFDHEFGTEHATELESSLEGIVSAYFVNDNGEKIVDIRKNSFLWSEVEAIVERDSQTDYTEERLWEHAQSCADYYAECAAEAKYEAMRDDY